MQNKALVIIDIQNDITKNYKEIIGNINSAIDWAVDHKIHVVYIKHNNLSDGTRTFKPGTHGEELVAEMKIVSGNIFTKTKGNALTSEEFAAFISENEIKEFYIAGADAVACVNPPVTIWLKKATLFMCCRIVLPAMINVRLRKCFNTMQARGAVSRKRGGE